ncbi:MAG: hypothetical protein ACXWLI_12590, partial [Myxococcaceae bacterium]
MSRVQVLGPRRLLAEVIRLLQAEGVLEIRSPAEDLAAARPTGRPLLRRVPIAAEQTAADEGLEAAVEDAERLLAALPPFRPGANGEE